MGAWRCGSIRYESLYEMEVSVQPYAAFDLHPWEEPPVPIE